MNDDGMIGLDGTGMRASPGSEKVKRTRSVEPSGSGMKVMSHSKSFRSAYERRSNNKKVSMLLVCAAAIIIVSGMSLASFGKGAQPTVPGHISIPPPPFLLYGYIKNSVGTPLANCVVTITDQTTTDTVTGIISDDGIILGDIGFYSYDLSNLPLGYTTGDTILVNSTGPGGTVGSNTGVLGTDPYLRINVTLDVAIPEFTAIVIPIVGMISIFAVARVASNRSEEEQL